MIRSKCGKKVQDIDHFCTGYGTSIILSEPDIQKFREEYNDGIIQWEISVSLFRNIVILKELGFALGIPFWLLILILFIISGGDISIDGIGYPLLFIGIFLVLGFLFLLLIYRGKYAAGYVIDTKGILNYTQEKQAKRNKIINSLLAVVGILSGKPSAAGAGILAQSRQSVLVKWKNIRKVKVYPNSNCIVVKGGFAEKIAVFCNDDNFEYVKSIILSKVTMIGE